MQSMVTPCSPMHTVSQSFNDRSTKCLVCFVCGEQRATLSGFECPNFEMESAAPKVRRAIEEVGPGYFKLLEQEKLGSLFNKCTYALWYERYVQKDILASEV